MKYCRNCGKQLNDEDRFCTSCGSNQDLSGVAQNPSVTSQINYGANVYQPYSPNQSPNNPYKGNTLGVVSLGLGVMIPIAGIVCGIVAIIQSKKVVQGVKIVGNKRATILGAMGIIIGLAAWIMNIITQFNQG